MEKKIEQRFRDRCKELGCKAVKYQDPGEDGAPDRQILTPWGLTIFVEFKRPGQHPRNNQLRYMLDLCERGFLAFAANDFETPINAIMMLRDAPDRDLLYEDLVKRQAHILSRHIPS